MNTQTAFHRPANRQQTSDKESKGDNQEPETESATTAKATEKQSYERGETNKQDDQQPRKREKIYPSLRTSMIAARRFEDRVEEERIAGIGDGKN